MGTDSLAPPETQDRPDKVDAALTSIFRAMALVRLVQKRLQDCAGDSAGHIDQFEASDLAHALDIAYESLDGTAENTEGFVERESVPALLQRQAS